MSYVKKHKEGFTLTILFHVAVLLLLLHFGFFTPLPLPEEKGVLVDFGTDNAGTGVKEPPRKPTPSKQEEQKEQETPPPKPVVSDALPAETKTNEGKEELMTQDFEQTASVDEGKKEEERKKQEQLEKKQREKEERDRLAAIEYKKQVEAEKRRKDSLQRIEDARLAELKKIAEQRRQDSIRKAKEQAKIDEINSRAKNVFGRGTGQDNAASNSTGQGITYQPGNQGTATGTPGAERYGLGGGEGISFNLTGRSAESLQKPSYPGQEEGIVVVQVTVDKYGKVTKATPGVRGSTSIDPGLLNAAQKAALSTRFNEDLNAPALQTGTITYHFVLD